MAVLTGWPTDGGDGSVSTEARWRKMARLWAPSGVVAGFGGELAPTAGSGVINVAAGAAFLDGHYTEMLSPGSEVSTANGLLVVRFTPASNLFELVFRDGATTPTQTDATWELPLARVVAGVLTDLRHMVAIGGSTTRRLGHVVLTASAAQIDFTDIPQDLNHLRLVAYLHGDAPSAVTNTWTRFNGDSGPTYFNQRLRAEGSTSVATFNANQVGLLFQTPAALSFSSSFATVTMDITGYRTSQGRQAATWVEGHNIIAGGGTPASGDLKLETGYGYRASASAITRITLAPNTGNFTTGSTATLYGFM